MSKKRVASLIVLSIGVLLLIAASVLPQLLPTETFWTPEQGAEHATASARLHQATLQSAERQESKRATEADRQHAQQELAAARARFESSQAALKRAQYWRETVPRICRYAGIVISAVAALAYFATGEAT